MKKLTIVLIVMSAIATTFLWWHYAPSPLVGEYVVERAAESTSTPTTTPAVVTTAPYVLTSIKLATSSYISMVDEPRLLVSTDTYACTEAGTTTARAGRTREVTINAKTVCATDVAEGAAGSVFHQYAYLTTTPTGELLQYTFTVREVQCQNYDEPQASMCLTEQAAFNPDSWAANLIMNTRRTQ